MLTGSCLAGIPAVLSAATVNVDSSPHLPLAERIVLNGADVLESDG